MDQFGNIINNKCTGISKINSKKREIIKTQALNRIKSQKIIFNRERLIEENENRRDEILNDELVKISASLHSRKYSI